MLSKLAFATARRTPLVVGQRFIKNSRLFASDSKDLINAAFTGDIKEVKRMVEKDKVPAQSVDYDRRSALHLAAAEGHSEVSEYLIQQGANVNSIDRFGRTPLEDAIDSKNIECVRAIRKHGGGLGASKASMANVFCSAAATADTDAMERLVLAGVDPNWINHEQRSPLHVAAGTGTVASVEWLIKNGAKVNVLDRFLNTPLQEAQRQKGRDFRSCSRMLLEAGAQDSVTLSGYKNEASLQTALRSTLPSLLKFTGADHAQVHLFNRDEVHTVLPTSTSAFKSHSSSSGFLNALTATGESRTLGANSSISQCASKQVAMIAPINEQEFGKLGGFAESVGFKSHIVVPIVRDGQTHGVISFLSLEDGKFSADQIAVIQSYSTGIIAAEAFGSMAAPVFSTSSIFNADGKNSSSNTAQMSEVYAILVNQGVFGPAEIYEEITHFYNMGFSQYYFRQSSKVIANHLQSLMAAKKLSESQGNPAEIWLHIENNHELLGTTNEAALYMISGELNKCMAAERRLQDRIAKLKKDTAFTMECYRSEVSPVVSEARSGSSNRLVIYLLSSETFPKKNVNPDVATSIWDIASESFLATTPKLARERFDQVVRDCSTRLAPVARTFEPEANGVVPMIFAFKHTTPSMYHLSQLLASLGLHTVKKFQERFANDVYAFAVYLNKPTERQIEDLKTQLTMLYLTPESSLTSSFLRGVYTANQYSFFSSAARFAYYFINQRTDEYDVLSEHFKNDSLNLARLRTLNTTLKREAVSLERIYETVARHPDIAQELYQEFKISATTMGKRALPAALVQRIKNLGNNNTDGNILSAMSILSTHLLKTNFYVRKKSAVSFRLDPSFVSLTEWPTQPYGLFFVVGAHFQGFHLRFQDIARGGVRMIKSVNANAYNNNLASLFKENFGLAFTQNKKNKDIPEFGSKGTVLLNPQHQHLPFYSFKCYVSALLDLLVGHPDILDKHQKTEVLFLGPDEGTADMMEWACLHARDRNYKFWRAFTTGKPMFLGGIPHDAFGMTTRSVHRYVLGVLAKEGIREEDITKVQTGGPDGDLGSNEILMSKDRTVVIVDGAGVVYDPEGLDRTELTRLAKDRSMIHNFDAKLLSPNGFKVLTSDTKVTLPHGEVVESGLEFRNSFHLHPLCTADLFVPCGGRPEAVKLSDVPHMFKADGKTPKFKYIIEGANLFFSQDARMVLEQKGIVLYKDASTNKGGVTSSSMEVLCALSLTDESFARNMSVTDKKNPPQFYSDYVKQICAHVENNADLEFECLHKEHKRTGRPRFLLTDQVSDKINNLVMLIQSSNLYEDKKLRATVLKRAIPSKLLQEATLEGLLERVPDSYLRATFATYIASRYIYQKGIDSNEFSFYDYMNELKSASN